MYQSAALPRDYRLRMRAFCAGNNYYALAPCVACNAVGFRIIMHAVTASSARPYLFHVIIDEHTSNNAFKYQCYDTSLSTHAHDNVTMSITIEDFFGYTVLRQTYFKRQTYFLGKKKTDEPIGKEERKA